MTRDSSQSDRSRSDALRGASTANIREWQQLVSAHIVPLHVTPTATGEPFLGRIRSRTLNDVTLSVIQATPHGLIRDVAQSGDLSEHYFNITLQLEGTSSIAQHGRQAVLQPGDLVVYDTWETYTRQFETDYRSFVIMLPQTRLALPTDVIHEVTAVAVSGQHGMGAVISKFLAGVAENLHEVQGIAATRLVQVVVDLVGATLVARLDVNASSHELRRRHLRALVRDYIDLNYDNPNCTPRSVASAFYVSERHLFAVFQDEDITVAEMLREKRLESARRALEDPTRSWMTVADIAQHSGFGSAAAFTRSFRTRYELTPRQVRRPNQRET